MTQLVSRNKDVHTTVDDEGLITTDSYVREIRNQDGSIFAIDFDGGPFIQTGDKVDGKVVKSITYKYKLNYE